jgi:predicted esterase
MNTRVFLPCAALAFAALACGSEAETDPGGTSSTAAATSSSSGGAGGSGGGAVDAPATPDPAFLPKVTGGCPAFERGKQTFSPEGIAPREVEIWAGDGSVKGGPLVFFWHGAGGSPTEASIALGTSTINAIKDMGGVVAAPYHDDAAGFLPWFAAMGGDTDDDMRVSDEILACAIEALGVDVRRIHSVGFSAGAMQTMQLSYARAGYIASIVAYSGSLLGTPTMEVDKNLFPAMLFHGGKDDTVIINFEQGTEAFRDKLVEAGHFAFICAHGKGHTLPTDGRASAWQFLQDHPYGTIPSPYAAGLPEGFPDYCSL